MSLSHSISTDSTTSSSTNAPTGQPNDQGMDPSNILYNDHQNYQVLFTNDSRFFDTSLHLYKSYRKLGYIQPDNQKPKKHRFGISTHTSKQQTNGHQDHGRSKSTGFRSHYDVDGHDDDTLKAQASRNNDRRISQRSDVNSSKLKTLPKKHENTNVGDGDGPTSRPLQRPLSKYRDFSNDSSDGPDVIVTRL